MKTLSIIIILFNIQNILKALIIILLTVFNISCSTKKIKQQESQKYEIDAKGHFKQYSTFDRQIKIYVPKDYGDTGELEQTFKEKYRVVVPNDYTIKNIWFKFSSDEKMLSTLLVAIPDDSKENWISRFHSKGQYIDEFYNFMSKSSQPKNISIVKKEEGVFLINQAGKDFQIGVFTYVSDMPIMIFVDAGSKDKNMNEKIAIKSFTKMTRDYIKLLDEGNIKF